MTVFEGLWNVSKLFPTMRPEKVESVDAEVQADMEKKNKKD